LKLQIFGDHGQMSKQILQLELLSD